MKKKSINKILALMLAFVMAFAQPTAVMAQNNADAPVLTEDATEETSEDATEETSEDATEETSEDATEETSEDATEETSEDATEETSEDVTEETTEVAVQEADALEQKIASLGFSAMELDQEMIDEKVDIAEVVDTIKACEEDKDYIGNEIVFFADDEAEAEKIAECYGGTLTKYLWGVGVATIQAEVIDALEIAANPKASLPAVYPNLYYTIDDVDVVEATEEVDEDEVVETDIPEEIKVPVDEELVFPMDDEQLYATAPNDALYTKQWHHSNINTVEAWNATKGAGITVAVIDSGIDYNHPDLKDNIVGWESAVKGSDGRDDNGHGTHCAGIIAATANNKIGISGVAPEANILSIKALNKNGSGTTDAIIASVEYATQQNVDVISMSLGGLVWDKAYDKAIQKAINKGIVVVAAAGNDGVYQVQYPAAYANVITVAATTEDNDLTYFSNYGNWVDIAAPGYNILSTMPTNFTRTDTKYEGTGYGYMSGTSMACPVVSGTVALMLANHPTYKNVNKKSTVTNVTKALLNSGVYQGSETYYYDTKVTYYPFVDVEASTYAMETAKPEKPTIKFKVEPDKKNVVLAGANEYFELSTTTQHSKIYYTTNGKKPTVKDGILYTGRVYMPKSGKVKIRAVTVVGSKTSSEFSKTYTFDAKATGIVVGDTKLNVAVGKSIQLNATIMPSYARVKKLEWTSSDTTGMIKVNKSSGKVTCNKKATPGMTATITAKTTDGTNYSKSFTITVVPAAATKITLNATKLNMSYWAWDYIEDNYGVVMDGYTDSFKLVPTVEGATTDQFIFKSSNPKVAYVGDDGTIYADAKGTATITVTANDGSGKKATCKVTVKNPVFNIDGVSNTGFDENETIPIARGYSITLKTTLNYGYKEAYYKPNDSKLVWTSSNPNVTVKNGKVTCKKSALAGTTVYITAKAKDGFGASQTFVFRVYDPIVRVGMRVEGYEGKTSYTLKAEHGGAYYDFLDNGVVGVFYEGKNSNLYKGLKVTNSNPTVAYRFYNSDAGAVLIAGCKPGTSKITYQALDGSNKKFTLTVKVK